MVDACLDDVADPMTAAGEAGGTRLDARLRAWFQALMETPVPESLLRYIETLTGDEAPGPGARS